MPFEIAGFDPNTILWRGEDGGESAYVAHLATAQLARTLTDALNTEDFSEGLGTFPQACASVRLAWEATREAHSNTLRPKSTEALDIRTPCPCGARNEHGAVPFAACHGLSEATVHGEGGVVDEEPECERVAAEAERDALRGDESGGVVAVTELDDLLDSEAASGGMEAPGDFSGPSEFPAVYEVFWLGSVIRRVA